jgi:steroid delta-isomerase-like uncharacterized protein
MTRSELATLTTEWISLWGAPFDRKRFDRLHADDFRDASPAGRPATKAGFAEGVVRLLRVFPDLDTRVEDLVIDEQRQSVAVRWSARGVAVEPFLGRGPTGRATSITGIEIVRVRDGRIVERWGEWDPEAGAP